MPVAMAKPPSVASSISRVHSSIQQRFYMTIGVRRPAHVQLVTRSTYDRIATVPLIVVLVQPVELLLVEPVVPFGFYGVLYKIHLVDHDYFHVCEVFHVLLRCNTNEIILHAIRCANELFLYINKRCRMEGIHVSGNGHLVKWVCRLSLLPLSLYSKRTSTMGCSPYHATISSTTHSKLFHNKFISSKGGIFWEVI